MPSAVAFADRVIVLGGVMVEIVVPIGMGCGPGPTPAIVSPAVRPVMLLIFVTMGDPLVSVPVKTVDPPV